MFRMSKSATRRRSIASIASEEPIKYALKQPKAINHRRKTMPAQFQSNTATVGSGSVSPAGHQSPPIVEDFAVNASPISTSATMVPIASNSIPTTPRSLAKLIRLTKPSTPTCVVRGRATQIVLSHVKDLDRSRQVKVSSGHKSGAPDAQPSNEQPSSA